MHYIISIFKCIILHINIKYKTLYRINVGMQYNTQDSSRINEIIQNADLLHNNTLLQKVYNVVNDITNLDLEDKRKLKFTTTLDSLEPHIIDKLCEVTGFTKLCEFITAYSILPYICRN